ncbi:10-formyltetrahydrofolate:L-methionyl-tRNA(fMet) N-formyltransferase [Candidatus Magnetomoraceae bacterium gMMP-15]
MKPLKIVYMGTPEFSIPSLKSLHKSNHDIIMVVTQPDRPKGRGKKIQAPPVKKIALEMGYQVVQPKSVNSSEFIEKLREVGPDLIALVAYGQMQSQEILDLPPLGIINVHPSLLPKYRGPAPIHWPIINGDKETGVTTMLMDIGMDTGDILLTVKLPIKPDDTAETMHDRLAIAGADLLIKTIDKLQAGSLKPIPQDHSLASYTPMLKKEHGKIDWQKDAESINNLVRGMTPWPGAFTFFKKKRIKIFKGEVKNIEFHDPPGTVIDGKDNEFLIATGKGAFSVLELQSASGKRLNIKDFLRGCHMNSGCVFEF